ncbi:uncharacterized protein LOC100876895 [Anopheles sinensis]|uniref:Uncharacterized protein LOC100876895 n=1 Tax=Anopheles sinensis TaxID=74873 RepID=A0A084VKT3_ANOSI|nr:uncharacterized protein LOC100876895 [Anopheles sinensis]
MGMWQRIRCVLDSGSQIEAISKDAAQRLSLTLLPARLTLNSVFRKIPVNKQIRAKVMATYGSCTMDLGFFVIPGLSDQPARTIGREELDVPDAKSLADSEFHHPGPIDAILGARECLERFWRIEELPNDDIDFTAWKSHELEAHFKDHTAIADDGRYIVRIPLRGELN